MKNLIFLLLLLSNLCACKKYEDDENFHLRSAHRRLSRTGWKIATLTNYIENKSKSIPSGEDEYFIKSEKFLGSFYPYPGENGNWKFVNKRNKIVITYSNSIIAEFIIQRLDNDNLWLKNDSLEWKLTPYNTH